MFNAVAFSEGILEKEFEKYKTLFDILNFTENLILKSISCHIKRRFSKLQFSNKRKPNPKFTRLCNKTFIKDSSILNENVEGFSLFPSSTFNRDLHFNMSAIQTTGELKTKLNSSLSQVYLE